MRTFDTQYKAAKHLCDRGEEPTNELTDRLIETGRIRHRFVGPGWTSEWLVIEEDDWWRVRGVRGDPEIVDGPFELKRGALGDRSGSMTEMDGVYAVDGGEDEFVVRHDVVLEQGWFDSEVEIPFFRSKKDR